MNKLFVSLACALSLGYLATAAPMKTSLASYNQGINIIPQPKELVQGKGSFTLTAKTPLLAQGDSAYIIARFFAEKLQRSTGYQLPVRPSSSAQPGAIYLRIDPSLQLGHEGYQLKSSPRGVEVVGRTGAGLYYGMHAGASLRSPSRTNPDSSTAVPWSTSAVTFSRSRI